MEFASMKRFATGNLDAVRDNTKGKTTGGQSQR